MISDTSAIRALHHLNLMSVLERLFGSVVVPTLVANELARPRPRLSLIDLSRFGWIRVTDPHDQSTIVRLESSLDRAEAAAIALAVELRADLLLIDEQANRRAAAALGVPTTWVLGVLVRAKARGLIADLTECDHRLRSELGFHISDAVLEEARRLAGEA